MIFCYITYGIRGISNKWFPLTHEVPQGSILGPVLFLIYINDISNSTSLNLLAFANDITIYQSDYDIDHFTTTVNQ